MGHHTTIREWVEGMQKTVTGVSRGVENTDDEEQLKDVERSVQR